MIYQKDIKFKQYKSLIYNIFYTILDWTNIHQPTLHQDQHQCIDLVSKQGYAAVRVRKASYIYRDLTIRNRQYNVSSQIDKIQNSPLTHYLLMYQSNNHITQVYIIDVQQMRNKDLFNYMKANASNHYQTNGDSTGFYYISLQKLKDNNCIVWSYKGKH